MMKPKLIYLDTNKWVDIGKAFHNRPGGDPFKSLLRKLEAKVSSGEILLPLSLIHLIEAQSALNPERRKRFAKILAHLSQANFLLPHHFVRRLEVRNAVARLAGKPQEDLSKIIVGKGAAYAFGTEFKIEFANAENEHIARELNQFFKTPEALEKIISLGIGERGVNIMSEDMIESAKEFEIIRQKARYDYPPEEYEKIAISEWVAGSMANDWKEAMLRFNLNPDTLFPLNWTPTDFMEFCHSIPTVDVFWSLSIIRDKQWGRPIHRNDLKDIGFLTIAIPYCDIVVLEKFFCDLINRSGLAARWGTIVINDLLDLETYL